MLKCDGVAFIQNPRFITDKPVHLPTLDIPLMTKPMEAFSEDDFVSVTNDEILPPSSSASEMRARVVRGMGDLGDAEESPRKKAKTSVVRFAD